VTHRHRQCLALAALVVVCGVARAQGALDLRGPVSHEVRVATEDGPGFRDSGSVAWDHASAPRGVRTADGRVLVYYANAYAPGVWLAESRDEGTTFRFRPVQLAGEGLGTVTEACPVVGDGGAITLYLLERFESDQGFPGTRVRRAHASDGVAFAVDPEPCCQGVTISTPDAYRLPDGRWVLHVSEGPRIWRASSSDGLTFTWDGQLPLRADGGMTATVEHEPGQYRLYFCTRDGISYYSSTDGLAWSQASTPALSQPGAGSPSPVHLASGWRLYYRLAHEMPRFRGAPPLQGPAAHRIISAFSTDLRSWAYESGIRLSMSSVEAPLRLADGRVLLYYVDASGTLAGRPETTNVAVSEDGLGFQALGLTIEGSPWLKALDPAPLLLADGRIRLYYYGCQGDPGAAGDHAIVCAVSGDGVHFTYEGECLRLPDLVDPDVWFDGQSYRMLVSAGKRTMQAVSDDGLAFTQSGNFPFLGWGTTRPVELTQGEWSLFAFGQQASSSGGNSVRRFSSADGKLWREAQGALLRAPEGWQITDPHVVPCEGGYRMYLKAEVRGLQ
jgi:hypothetical protein